MRHYTVEESKVRATKAAIVRMFYDAGPGEPARGGVMSTMTDGQAGPGASAPGTGDSNEQNIQSIAPVTGLVYAPWLVLGVRPDKTSFTTWPALDKPRYGKRSTCSWPQARAYLATWAGKLVPSKDDTPQLIWGVTSDGYRRDKSVEAITGLVLDYDGKPGPVSLAQASAWFAAQGLGALLYETKSSTPDSPRWRAVVPIAAPWVDIPTYRASAYERLRLAFEAELGVAFDPEGYKPSQGWLVPTRLSEQAPAREVVLLDGVALDMPATLARLPELAAKPKPPVPAKPPARPRAKDGGQAYVAAAIEAELATLAGTAQGQNRNLQLFKSAASLYGFAQSELVSQSEVEAGLRQAGEANGLIADYGEQAFLTTLRSAWEKATPREVPERERARSKPAKAETGEAGNGHKQPAAYAEQDGGIVLLKYGKDGSRYPVRLTNFTARIVANVAEDDGQEIARSFELEASVPGVPAQVFRIPASRFFSMSWPAEQLGSWAIVEAGTSAKDHARAAIQHLSGEAVDRHVYVHLGWRELAGHGWAFLHCSGALGAQGPVAGVEVALPSALGGFELPAPPAGPELVYAVKASLSFLEVAPDKVTLPLWLALWRAVLGGADFSCHLVGPTGAGKTALAAVLQQHLGPGMDALHLPASFASTGNALESVGFKAKDGLLVVDEYTPTGSSRDVSRLQATAERIYRGAGNQAGRARLKADATLVEGKPPRCLILSTGEDTPPGESLRARMLVIELEKGNVDLARLTALQEHARAGTLAQAMSAFVSWLAPRLSAERESLRARGHELRPLVSVGHARTRDIVGQLGATAELVGRYLRDVGLSAEADALQAEAWPVLLSLAGEQARAQEDSNPALRFVEAIGSILTSGLGHVCNPQGGNPDGADMLGWRYREAGPNSGWQPQGPCLGWAGDDDGELWLEPGSAYHAAVKFCLEAGQPLAVAEITLWKRLAQAGLLAATDTHRLTVKRAVCGKRPRILCLSYRRKSGACGASGALADKVQQKREVTKSSCAPLASNAPEKWGAKVGREQGAEHDDGEGVPLKSGAQAPYAPLSKTEVGREKPIDNQEIGASAPLAPLLREREPLQISPSEGAHYTVIAEIPAGGEDEQPLGLARHYTGKLYRNQPVFETVPAQGGERLANLLVRQGREWITSTVAVTPDSDTWAIDRWFSAVKPGKA